MALQPSIDKEVNTLTDAYLKNPQGLQQKQRLDPSMTQAIALERVLELLKAEQNTINAQMQTSPTTVKDQTAEQIKGMTGGQNESVADVGGAAQAKGIASAMPQSNQNMPKMASGGKVQKFQYGGLAAYADKADKQTQVRNQDSTRAELEAKKAALIEGVQKGTISATRARQSAADIDKQLQKLNTAITEQGADAVTARRETAVDNKSKLLEELGVTPEAPPSEEGGIASVPVGTGTVLRGDSEQYRQKDAPEAKKEVKEEVKKKVAPKQETPGSLGTTSAMDAMAMKNLSDAMGKDSAKAGDDAYDKFRERAGASGLKAEYDRMRTEQDAVNERYARSPKQEARDRVFAFFATAGSEQSGVAGLSKATLADQKLREEQKGRTQAMLDKSLALDKEFLTKELGLSEKAAERAALVQNNTDTLKLQASEYYQNLKADEQAAADRAADREITQGEGRLNRVHERLMLTLGSEAKYNALTLAGKLEIQKDLLSATMEIESADANLTLLRNKLAKEKNPDGKKARALRTQLASRQKEIKDMTAAYMNNAMEMIDKLAIDTTAGSGSGDDTMTPNAESYIFNL